MLFSSVRHRNHPLRAVEPGALPYEAFAPSLIGRSVQPEFRVGPAEYADAVAGPLYSRMLGWQTWCPCGA